MLDKRKKSVQAFLGFFRGFSLLITYELIEELLENVIAWTITWAIAKTISFILVVFLTQITKSIGKMIGKAIATVVKPVVKRFVYKEGNDKVEAIHKLFRRRKKMEENEKQEELVGEIKVPFIKKLATILKSNKRTITLSSVIALLVAVGCFLADKVLPSIEFIYSMPQWSYYLVLVAGTVIIALGLIIGVVKLGGDSERSYMAKQLLKAVGLEHAIPALSQIKAQQDEDRLVEEELEREKQRLLDLAIAEENARLEREAEIEAEKQRILIAQQEQERLIEEEKQRIIEEQRKADEERRKADEERAKQMHQEEIHRLAVEKLERERLGIN